MNTLAIEPGPEAFGLGTFADLLPAREPIIGEDPGSFDAFHQAMVKTLVPMTPYAGVVAENLITIEWELLQHRRMRDALVRQRMREDICKAVIKQQEAEHEAAVDEAWDKHEEAGGTEADWEDPFAFDQEEAERLGNDLAERATSRDTKSSGRCLQEITALGLKPVELMSEAYASDSSNLLYHEEKIQELERRRREVKRDFDALQKTRPIEAMVIEPEEVEA